LTNLPSLILGKDPKQLLDKILKKTTTKSTSNSRRKVFTDSDEEGEEDEAASVEAVEEESEDQARQPKSSKPATVDDKRAAKKDKRRKRRLRDKEADANKVDQAVQEERVVFLRNIDIETDDDDLKEMASQFGECAFQLPLMRTASTE